MILEMHGTTPLLMKNIRSADPQDPYSKMRNEITDKKTKDHTDAEQHELARIDFAQALYFDEKMGPYLPAANIFQCLIESGRKKRLGTKIQGGLVILSDKARLEYDGPRTIEGLWNDGDSRFIDRRVVNKNPTAMNPKMIPAVRPVFPEWSASIEIDFDDEVLDFDDVATTVQRAGRMVGLGDFRKLYGRFDGKVVE